MTKIYIIKLNSLLNLLIQSNYLKILVEISKLQFNYYSISWKDQNQTLINALKVEKNVMFIILTLIIIVASLNIISGLIIFVKEKNKDIGILRVFGMSQVL